MKRLGFIVLVLLAALPASAQVERIAYDYTAMYDALNPSIVKVHVDSGSGSGFLVTPSGMIATNHHVVRNTRYIAVEFPDGRKFSADIILLDAQNDLALLKVHPSVLGGARQLPLLAPERDATVCAGIPVVAFGSPLSQTFLMTQGIVSKVEPGVLLGDFLIQPGNSGGPLVNLQGEVVGINTFGEDRISGAVRVNVLRDALASELIRQYDREEPSDAELPRVPWERFPTALLKAKVAEEPLDPKDYALDGGRFTITAVTPVLIAKTEVQEDLRQAENRYKRRGKKIKDEAFDPSDEPFYNWLRNAGQWLDTVVTFHVRPDYGQTAGSAWSAGLAAFAAGYSGTPMPPPRQTLEFKAEFQEFRVLRDGELIQPITPGRQIDEQFVSTTHLTFVDEAYSGMYVYDPSVFLTGSEYQIEVYDARQPDQVHKVIRLNEKSRLIQRIRSDFEGALHR